MKFKQMFFTSKAVLSATDRATCRVLSRFGAYVRRTAKQSIRNRKKASRPGQSPTNQTGLLKNNIFFVVNPAARNVIIGPIRLNSRSSGGNAPQVLEEGGMVSIRNRRGKIKSVYIQPRPYMGPAFAENLPKLPQLWRNSITK